MSTLINLIALLLTITWHEWGHYLAARLAGVPVESFNVGLGASLLSRTDRRQTSWALRAIPIGGYVKFREGAFEAATPLKKFLIAAAGPAMNFALISAACLYFGMWGKMVGLLGTLYWDTLVGFCNLLLLPLTSILGWFASEGSSVASTAHQVSQSSNGFTGPLGLATMQHSADTPVPVTFVIWFFIFNLGIMLFNLLPIPGLDGGRMLFAVVETVIGQARSKAIEQKAIVAGALLLIYAFIILFVLDLGRMF